MSGAAPHSPIIWWKAILGILLVAGLAVGVPFAGGYVAHALASILHIRPHGLARIFWEHGGMLLVALAAIAAAKRLVPADYGLHLPHGRSYVGAAVAWGVAFGVIMLLVDYIPELAAGTKPDAGFPLTSANVGGWLVFEGVWVGPTEEVPFRALLVPLLMALFPARLTIGRFDMAWAGVIVALLFAAMHASSFSTRHPVQAVGQQIYAFAQGVLAAYWLEKSRSVVAPVIVHNLGDGLEYLLMFAWIAFLP